MRFGFRGWVCVALAACGGATVKQATTNDDSPAAPAPSSPPADIGNAGSSSPDASQGNDASAALDAGTAPSTPPPLPSYSHGTCPTLVGGPTTATSLTTGFATGTETRAFHVVVPHSYDGSKPWPVAFAWHWLNASAGSLIADGELESATEQMHFIAVVPEHLTKSDGSKVYQFDWPFIETWDAPKELLFFDDMLACVAAQYNVDTKRVYGMGVSAGALWVTYLSTTDRVQHLAAVESMSGGLGSDPSGLWKMQYQPQPNKSPALVLWGGSSDWLVVDFQKASQDYRDALRADDHFVVECTHDAGHAMPPIAPVDGGTRFASMWQFLLDHPYGLPPGTSPYQQTGLPSAFPSWCRIAP